MNHEINKKHVFIVLSQTHTRFGFIIRKVTGEQFNHVSIAFDENLAELYSFGRYQHKVPLVAGLIKEFPERFSLSKSSFINVRIYKIPVSCTQYKKGKRRIRQITKDKDGYLYNLFSVISYPVIGGFSTFKAYSCAEFVAHLLRYMNILIDDERPEYSFTPENLGSSFNLFLEYEGNLLEYCSHENDSLEYYMENPNYLTATGRSFLVLSRLIYRMLRYKINISISWLEYQNIRQSAVQLKASLLHKMRLTL